MSTILRSLANLGVPVPNIAYCSVKLYFDKVFVNKRPNGKPPIVVLERDNKRKIIKADKVTQEWFNLDKLPKHGQPGYVELPAYIAEDLVE